MRTPKHRRRSKCFYWANGWPVMIPKSQKIKGKIRSKPKKIKSKIRKKPYRSSQNSKSRQEIGRTENKIFEPSSGGTGIRLKIAKRRFIKTIITKNGPIAGRKEKFKNLITRPKIIAKKMLAAGPDNATKAGPHFLFFKLSGLKGTGLAQPMIIVGAPKSAGKARSSGKIIEPNGSKCGKGFRVNRPAASAVLSP